MSDLQLMQRALEEAHQSSRAVRPNPRVGCALKTRAGAVVSAHHEKFGGPHAEARVLDACREQGLSVEGATVAVTLEPCAHFGKTPPCAEALVSAGVGRVVVGARDPHDRVSGKGLECLRAAGIEVVEGVLEKECRALNAAWLFAQTHRRPFYTLKMATSLDGLWTSDQGESQWITGTTARAYGHVLRSRVDAIVTSASTIAADDPAFTVRPEMLKRTSQQEVHFAEDWRGEQPQVCVLTRRTAYDLPVGSQLAQDLQRVKVYAGMEVAALNTALFQQGFYDVMVEAGPTLSSAFLEGGWVDEVWLFLGPRLLGGEGKHLSVLGKGRLPGCELENLETRILPEGDIWMRLRPRS